MIPSARREILPHKLQHLLTLLHTRKTRRLLLPQHLHLLLPKPIVSMHIPRPHQQNIPKPHLRPLRLRHSLQIPQRNRLRRKRVVLAALRHAPLVVVQQDPAADDALLAPGADAVDGAVGGFAVGAVDVVEGDAVVEDLFFLVAEMAQAIPL